MSSKEGHRNELTEKKIISIWKVILGIENIDCASDFFELGGDSIMAINMLFEVGSVIGADLPPGLLFEYPILANFSAAVNEALATAPPEGQEAL